MERRTASLLKLAVSIFAPPLVLAVVLLMLGVCRHGVEFYIGAMAPFILALWLLFAVAINFMFDLVVSDPYLEHRSAPPKE